MLVPSTPLPTTSKMLMPRRQTAASADTPAGGRNRNSSGPTGRRCSPCGLTLHTPSPSGAAGSIQIHRAPSKFKRALSNSSGFLRPVFSLDKLREHVWCPFHGTKRQHKSSQATPAGNGAHRVRRALTALTGRSTRSATQPEGGLKPR